MRKLVILYGGVAGTQAACSAMCFIKYANIQTTVMQEYLSRAPELTDKVIEASNNAAENFGSGNLVAGVVFGTLAGICAGLALYDATKKE